MEGRGRVGRGREKEKMEVAIRRSKGRESKGRERSFLFGESPNPLFDLERQPTIDLIATHLVFS
jgi:hypothetical protein